PHAGPRAAVPLLLCHRRRRRRAGTPRGSAGDDLPGRQENHSRHARRHPGAVLNVGQASSLSRECDQWGFAVLLGFGGVARVNYSAQSLQRSLPQIITTLVVALPPMLKVRKRSTPRTWCPPADPVSWR